MGEKSKCSYPIKHLLADTEIEDTLVDNPVEEAPTVVDKNKALAEVYKAYLPEGLDYMRAGIRSALRQKRQESKDEAAFMNALSNWKNGKTQ